MEINLLSIQTSQLAVMKEFYTGQLGFSLVSESMNRFQIKTGTSLIEFTDENAEGEPYYHFALNIPSNQFQEAKRWLKGKTELLLEDGEDEIYFSFIDAHSCYFEDPSGNIVELIARHMDNPTSESPFSVNSILNIGEIGLIVQDVTNTGERFKEIHFIERDNEVVKPSFLNFMHDGDPGVFILLTGAGRRWLFSEKKSVIFPLKMIVNEEIIFGVDREQEFYIKSLK